MKIAVIGSGISGITASYLLSKKHDVTLFEQNERIGGHANGVNIKNSSGDELEIDTEFIVLNDCNYGVLHNLLSEWQVDVRWSEMSFSYYNKSTDYYYATTDVFALFPKAKLIYSKIHLLTIYEFIRFSRLASRYLENRILGIGSQLTLGEFLKKEQFSKDFIVTYFLPLASEICSVLPSQILDFPALNFIASFRNYGLLVGGNRPRLQTVKGGNSAYLSKFKERFKGKILTESKIVKISRFENEVKLSIENSDVFSFDEVVIACNADQILSLLEEPSEVEQEVFSKWQYEENVISLHTDSAIMPPKKLSWASWNFQTNEKETPVLTYYMNKVQGIKDKTDYFVSLNCSGQVKEEKIIQKIHYAHPVFSLDSLATQSKIGDLQGRNRTFFCGSYLGNGTYEDGARAGAQVALRKGITL